MKHLTKLSNAGNFISSCEKFKYDPLKNEELFTFILFEISCEECKKSINYKIFKLFKNYVVDDYYKIYKVCNF